MGIDGISKNEASRMYRDLDVGAKETGEREVLGFDIGLREDGAFWTSFRRVFPRYDTLINTTITA